MYIDLLYGCLPGTLWYMYTSGTLAFKKKLSDMYLTAIRQKCAWTHMILDMQYCSCSCQSFVNVSFFLLSKLIIPSRPPPMAIGRGFLLQGVIGFCVVLSRFLLWGFCWNVSFKSSGIICWSLLPSSLPGELLMDKQDSNGFLAVLSQVAMNNSSLGSEFLRLVTLLLVVATIIDSSLSCSLLQILDTPLEVVVKIPMLSLYAFE